MITNNKKILSFVFKGFVTGILILFFSVRIARHYQTFKEKLKKDISLRDFFLVDEQKILKGARTTTLNQLIPNFDDLIRMNDRKNTEQNWRLEKYITYYRRLVEYHSDIAEAYGILGFCYYWEGETTQAVTSFKKAIELNPHFFYFYYDLGVLFFRQGQNQKAKEYFAKARSVSDPRITLFVLMSSKIYRQIRLGGRNFPKDLTYRLRKAYRQSRFYLSVLRQKDAQKEKVFPPFPLPDLKIF